MSTPIIQYLLALLLEGFIDRAKLERNRWDKPWGFVVLGLIE